MLTTQSRLADGPAGNIPGLNLAPFWIKQVKTGQVKGQTVWWQSSPWNAEGWGHKKTVEPPKDIWHMFQHLVPRGRG